MKPLPELKVDRKEVHNALFPTESGRIIDSRLQNDFYKLTMGNFIHRFYPATEVTFGFKNRSKNIHLAEEIDEAVLRRELDHAKALIYTPDELRYLANLRNDSAFLFRDEFLDYLSTSRLPEYNLSVVEDGKQFAFETTANWNDVTEWEILFLTIVSALRTEALLRKKTKMEIASVVEYTAQAIERKIETLRKYPHVTFSDFSTRRAASPALQNMLVRIGMEHLKRGQFVGTSNTFFARENQTMPVGTNAHELQMVVAALSNSDEELRNAVIPMLRQWYELYGWGLSIILPDTFGSDWMFKHLPIEFAQKWKGMRQDSMDPVEFGEKQIAFYQNHGVDPRERLMIPSDGLNLDGMISTTEHFRGRMKISSGWGTLWGNDTSLGHPSIIAKAIRANGRPCVKLPDNIAKAMGPEDEVQRYARVFDYHVLRNVRCDC